MLTGIEMAVLLALLLGGGITVGLVMMTFRSEGAGSVPGHSVQDTPAATPLDLHEQEAEFLVGLCEPLILEPVGERDRDQAERQHQ